MGEFLRIELILCAVVVGAALFVWAVETVVIALNGGGMAGLRSGLAAFLGVLAGPAVGWAYLGLLGAVWLAWDMVRHRTLEDWDRFWPGWLVGLLTLAVVVGSIVAIPTVATRLGRRVGPDGASAALAYTGLVFWLFCGALFVMFASSATGWRPFFFYQD